MISPAETFRSLVKINNDAMEARDEEANDNVKTLEHHPGQYPTHMLIHRSLKKVIYQLQPSYKSGVTASINETVGAGAGIRLRQRLNCPHTPSHHSA